jgi:hypothetical protein
MAEITTKVTTIETKKIYFERDEIEKILLKVAGLENEPNVIVDYSYAIEYSDRRSPYLEGIEFTSVIEHTT